MKLEIVTTAFARGSVAEVLERVVRHGFETVEFPTGNYGGTPCFDLDVMTADTQAVHSPRAARVSGADGVFITFTNVRWSDIIHKKEDREASGYGK